MKPGDDVRLLAATPNHDWTEKLVGDEGCVVEVKDKAVAVSGLMGGDPLWFSPKQLKAIEEKRGAA